MFYKEEQEGSIFSRLRLQFLSFFKSDFFSSRHTRRPLTWALLINIILWVVTIIKTGLEVRPIPLHFNVGYGIEMVGPAYWLLELPLIGLLVLIANIFVAGKFFNGRPYLAHFLNYTSLLVQLILFLASIAIMALNY